MTVETIDNKYNLSVEVQPLNARFHGDLIADGQIDRFRNIKYGSIPSRFALPSPFKYDNTGGDLTEVDSTKQGPICPQATPYKDSLIGIPEDMVRPFELIYDEFECLNLMITRPVLKSGSASRLPVVIWIHGGGNTAGTPYRTICDPTDWVLQSSLAGKPIIFVSLQFRVHLFGNLPYNGIGNFILHDQRLGIEWVHDYIKYFGGDENLVSVIGQSAGSCCVSAQACAKGANRLFKRIGLMSGSISSMPCMSLNDYDIKTEQLAKSVGVESIEDLKTLPWEKLVEAGTNCNFNVAFPVDDGHFLDHGEFGQPHTLVESVIISDCIEDGYFFTEYMNPNGHELFKEIKDIGIDEHLSGEILNAYNIGDDDSVHSKLGDLITDAFFCNGNELMDNELRRLGSVRVFRQFFDCINPFNPTFGNNHMIEVIYFFNAYSVSPEYEHITRTFQSKWIEFFYGRDPWDPDHILLVSSDHKIKEIPIHQRAHHRRIDKFPLLSKINKKLMHRITCDGWDE